MFEKKSPKIPHHGVKIFCSSLDVIGMEALDRAIDAWFKNQDEMWASGFKVIERKVNVVAINNRLTHVTTFFYQEE